MPLVLLIREPPRDISDESDGMTLSELPAKDACWCLQWLDGMSPPESGSPKDSSVQCRMPVTIRESFVSHPHPFIPHPHPHLLPRGFAAVGFALYLYIFH